MNIFGGSSQNWTSILRGHFYAFYGLFLWSRYRMGVFLEVANNSNFFYFFGGRGEVLEIPDVFWG